MSIDLESLPVVGRAYQLGVSPVTTTLVLLGPIVLGVIVVAGRSPTTVALGSLYVLSLPVAIAYFWATSDASRD